MLSEESHMQTLAALVVYVTHIATEAGDVVVLLRALSLCFWLLLLSMYERVRTLSLSLATGSTRSRKRLFE